MSRQPKEAEPEPWLRGSHGEVTPIERAVVHSIEMAREDVGKWCGGLSEEEFHRCLPSLPSVAFQIRHIARSMDRFLTYLDRRPLTTAQFEALAGEKDPIGAKAQIFEEFSGMLARAEQFLRLQNGRPLDSPLTIGRRALPTTYGGLLVHFAEHTQRHVGQAITTAKLIAAQRGKEAVAGQSGD